MGGGISRHELAAAVSEAGGLGTIAVNGAGGDRARAGRRAGAHRSPDRRQPAAALRPPRAGSRPPSAADVVVTFWGAPKRRTPGDLDPPVRLGRREARAAHARRRRRGDRPGRRGGRPRARHACPAPGAARARPGGAAGPDFPLLLAGGIAERGPTSEPARSSAGRRPAAPSPAPASCSRDGEPRPPRLQRRALLGRPTTTTPHRALRRSAGRRRTASSPTPRPSASSARRDARAAGSTGRSTASPAPGARFTPASVQLRLARAQRPGQPPALAAGPDRRRPRDPASTPARSTPARRWRGSTTSAPRPRSSPTSPRDAPQPPVAGTTAMSSRANLPFASSGSPSG